MTAPGVTASARIGVIGTIAVALVLMLVGWHLLWHYADDAFITFRYVSNAMLGHGLVWNAAPFHPVDGNTYFLWSLLLLAVWKLFGVEPPDSANWMSLAFALVIFGLLARAVWRVALPERLERTRPVLLAASLWLLVTNRAFLASASSGLGMVSFNAAVFAWSLLAASPRTWAAPRRWFAVGGLAAICALARPEGLLVAAATVGLLPLLGLVARPRRLLAGIGAAATAAIPVLCHVAWRKATTGDWLPCPYYAKTTDGWPESGIRFFGSFVIEFGILAWLALAVVWLGCKLRDPGPLALLRRENLGASAVGAVFAYHFAYYTFFMGGDLFEWRVYTHLVPWLPLSFVLMLRTLPLSPRVSIAWLLAYAVLAVPVGWLKFAVHDAAVAPCLPAPLRPLLEPYDEWQLWLTDRFVCKRNYEMKVNFDLFVGSAPPRSVGALVPADGFPVLAAPAVGVIAWVLPNVAIIDCHGLNDAVIARNPVLNAAERLARRQGELRGRFEAFDRDRDGRVGVAEFEPWFTILRKLDDADRTTRERAAAEELARFDRDGDGFVTIEEYLDAHRLHADPFMAHEREAPPGYVEGFRPNVAVTGDSARVLPRQEPLTEAAIRAHEAEYRARFGAPR